MIARKSETVIPQGQSWLLKFLDTLQQPTVLLDEQGRIVAASPSFYALICSTPQLAIGAALRDVCADAFQPSAVEELLALVKANTMSVTGYRLDSGEQTGGRKFMACAQRVPWNHGREAVMIAIEETFSMGERAARMAEPPQRSPSPLASANHAIRQPLQTLSLLQGVMAAKVNDTEGREFVRRFEEAIAALVGIINALTAGDQLEAATIRPEVVAFSIASIFTHLRAELAYYAEARGLKWRVVSSSLVVRSDPRLLEQVLRTLLMCAMNLVKRGKVLFGGRRLNDKLMLQVWVRGSGVPAEAQQAILEEFQASNATGTRGAGKAFAGALSDLLGLNLKCKPQAGNGLVFSAEVPIAGRNGEGILDTHDASGAVLVASDDVFARDMLVALLGALGHKAQTASIDDDYAVRIDDNFASMQPEVAVFDVKEPGDVSIDRSIASLRAMLGWKIPVIILDADKTGWRGAISEPYSCLAKPIWPQELGAQVARFLGRARFHAAVRGRHSEGALLQTVHIVDDDRILRDAASEVLGQLGVKLALYATGEDFLERFDDNDRGCLIVDNVLPGMNGVELLERLQADGRAIPSIMLTGHANTQSAVRALKAGAIDYVEKPISYEKLLSIVDRALEIDRGNAVAGPNRRDVFHRIEELTQRERQVLDLVVSGHTSKKIASILKISQRTVENHRAAVMKRVGATSLPDLIRIGLQLKSARDR